MSRDRSDYATTVRVSSLTPADKSRKIRVAGRYVSRHSALTPTEYVHPFHSLQTCDLGHSMIVIEDGETPLLTDISLCLTGQTSYPWLRERNTTVVAIGYLDVVDMIVEDVSVMYMAICSMSDAVRFI